MTVSITAPVAVSVGIGAGREIAEYPWEILWQPKCHGRRGLWAAKTRGIYRVGETSRIICRILRITERDRKDMHWETRRRFEQWEQ